MRLYSLLVPWSMQTKKRLTIMRIRIAGILVLLFLLCCQGALASGLEYEKYHDRFSFAQLYMALDALYPVDSFQIATLDSSGVTRSRTLKGEAQPRMTIGGFHFWGHVDFYVTFPLTSASRDSDSIKFDYTSGVETGFHYYPWKRRINSLRPFVGGSWNYRRFSIKSSQGEGDKDYESIFPVGLGVSYTASNWGADLGWQWFWQNELDYAVSRDTVLKQAMPQHYLSLAIRYHKETSSFGRKFTAAPKRYSWSAGLGVSSAFSVFSRGEYRATSAPWLDEQIVSDFPEASVGFEYHPWKVNFVLSYRPMHFVQSGLGSEIDVKRDNVALDIFYLVLDYHGFVPFVGVSLGVENVRASHTDAINNTDRNLSDRRFTPGVIFGWDIRPLPTPSFVLRTNLRYYPNVNMLLDNDDSVYRSDFLEFNFIQAVWFFNY